MDAQPATLFETEVEEMLLNALDRSDQPKTAKNLRKDLLGFDKGSEKQLVSVLDQLVERGRAYRYAPYGDKDPRYWTRDHSHYIRQILQSRLEKPQTRSQLWSGTKTLLRGYSEKQRNQALSHLVQEGLVHEWPLLLGAKAKRLCVHQPKPEFFLSEALDKIANAFKDRGLQRSDIEAAARTLLGTAPYPANERSASVSAPKPEPSRIQVQSPEVKPRPEQLSRADVAQFILERMPEIEPQAPNGASVSLYELWKTFDVQQVDKPVFDAAVLDLARSGKIMVHRTDFPQDLPPLIRAALVPDGRGEFYNTIALRG